MKNELQRLVERASINRHFEDAKAVHRFRHGMQSKDGLEEITNDDEEIAAVRNSRRFNILQEALRIAAEKKV